MGPAASAARFVPCRKFCAGASDLIGRGMSDRLLDMQIIGAHAVVPDAKQFDDAVGFQWGPGLSGAQLEKARRHTREHFDGLRLMEVQITPAGAEVDWGAITQRLDGVPASNWQVAYSEMPVEGIPGRWTFFLHCVDRQRPLSTPVGDRSLPEVTPRPMRLALIDYELP